MSGFSIALNHRTVCPAGGKDYKRFLRANPPDAHGLASCPLCGKRVALKVQKSSGLAVVIPRHLELIVGL